MKLKTTHYYLIFFAVVIIGGIALGNMEKKEKEYEPGEYDEFAQCLTDSGAKFYGAFWCSHCNAQKRMFGNSVRLLPYIECSTPDKQSQIAECVDAGIQSYPTWVFSDGTHLPGKQTMQTLSDSTSCELPTFGPE